MLVVGDEHNRGVLFYPLEMFSRRREGVSLQPLVTGPTYEGKTNSQVNYIDTGEKIVVIGGSGKAGRAVIKELLEHGYEVLNADLAPSREPLVPHLKVDLIGHFLCENCTLA